MGQREKKRKSRNQLSKVRVPELGYYLIVTNTEETEKTIFMACENRFPRK